MRIQLFYLSFSVIVTLVSSETHQYGDCSQCKLKADTTPLKTAALEKLKPLCGKTFSSEDSKYIYSVGICTSASKIPEQNTVGVIQTEILKKDKEILKKDKSYVLGKSYMLGSINQTDIMSGDNWIYLEYEGGEQYNHACNQEHRRAIVMITCKKGDTYDALSVLEEDANKTSECHYLFQLSHDAACVQETAEGLSAGGIICIIFFTVTGAYLIFGGLYMRCIVGAKGWNQIPNYEFWKDFGNLQADGCDLIFRCGSRSSTHDHYHGIGDHQIESANDDERDEHLLPM